MSDTSHCNVQLERDELVSERVVAQVTNFSVYRPSSHMVCNESLNLELSLKWFVFAMKCNKARRSNLVSKVMLLGF